MWGIDVGIYQKNTTLSVIAQWGVIGPLGSVCSVQIDERVSCPSRVVSRQPFCRAQQYIEKLIRTLYTNNAVLERFKL